MYIPRHFALEDVEEIASLVAQVGTADIVTVAEDGSPESSLLPVLWDRTPTQQAPFGRLIAHAAIMNEQFVRVSNGARALAIVRGGQAYGGTDDFGFRAVDRPVQVHDLHATLLHLLGIDHERLTYRYAGRDFRLTDISGEVIRALV